MEQLPGGKERFPVPAPLLGEAEAGENAPVGAVLVVGAGIGGMQAALDLANSGFKVYLLDRSPAIGGIMAMLDKTFPTNDCAMCILSPKLVECGRHLNIEILTMAELEDLQGTPGRFTARIRRHPRFIDVQKCTGCGDCAEACPIRVPDPFNAGLSERKAVYKLYPQAIPNAFAIEKRGTAPCRNACPIHQRAEGYIALIAEGKYEEAYRTIREDNPFPAICGRICNHRCEDECTRGRVDEPVSIMRLKRFVVDWVRRHGKGEGPRAKEGKAPLGRVAVVGSGPAGLTCALDLVRLGYAVTVFEALSVPGGMMRVGVPEYRLPRALIQREIDDILAEGVELRLNSRVEDLEALFAQGYQAVFLAMGAHRGRKLRIPGADLPEVLLNTDFLRDVALGNPPDLSGKRVLVLGGGNVAMDCARTALRLGAAHVQAACLESAEQMPAHPWEVEEAREEGVEILNACTFLEITQQDGHVTGLRCARVVFRGFFADGRPDMDVIPDSEHHLPADVIIFAIGQVPETAFLEQAGLARRPNGTLVVDPETLMTSRPGIFAGGDVVTGTTFVVEAIAAGHRAARAIDRYLRGEAGIREPVLQPVVEIPQEELDARRQSGLLSRTPRISPSKLPAEERRRSFAEVEGAFSEEEARQEAARCLQCGICSECLACARACKAGAVNHEMAEEVVEIPVGAVILTPGVGLFDARLKEEFGYGRYKNVLTSIEFERMLSASGPFAGHLRRPSDGREPRRIAWIQCIGSRESGCGQNYCSSVCCMYATKEAIIAREHAPEVEPTIFFLDIRAFGKGFEGYYESAQREHGIRYIRSFISAIKEDPATGNLRLVYATPEGETVEEEFDLVVLSVGLVASPQLQETARRLGVALNRYGFAETHEFSPVETGRPGVFVAGAFRGPKDIPETVVEASAAAAAAARLLAPARGTLARRKVYPPEVDVRLAEPRVGVFICHCGINIGSVVNVPEVVEYARTLPGVAHAEHNLYTCSQDTQQKITDTVRELGLNRVVVASCTPRTHEPLFQDTIREAGLNPYLFEMANIREQDSWVHRMSPEVATEKAKDLVAMAVAKALRLRPIHRPSVEIEHSALVIGGGPAGMLSALTLADQGFPVTLIEREKELGGNLRHLRYTLRGNDPQAFLQRLQEEVQAHPWIRVYTETELLEVGGYVGRFHSRLHRRAEGRVEEMTHGAIVVATGAEEYRPRPGEYLYGEHPAVLTQRELEQILADRPETVLASVDGRPPSFVMIQCVGSRDEEHPYCSRICCSIAVKNALRIKERAPEAQVTVLFRDIRTYGFQEEYYEEARRRGVLFLEYRPERKPQVVAAGGRLQVEVESPGVGRLALPADRVILSTGIVPHPDSEVLAQVLKVPLTQDRFFLEAHVKLRPLDFAADGIYLCGLAHSPKSLEETLAQAQGAAIRAATLLSQDRLEAQAIVAQVNPRLCKGCGLCVAVCPYEARVLNEETHVAEVIEVLCQGCGACAVACPSGATQHLGFEKVQIYAMIDEALD
ncbi:MAG: FAD-dependent oxidoreductase [Chloroflexia bacterium]